MATAKDELEEITGTENSGSSGGVLAQYAQELKAERAKEEEGLPTIREALAEIGRDPEKYGDILDKSGSMALWEEVYKPQNTLETGALTLLAAARQSGAEPEEYLSRLAPYFDSKVQYLPRLSSALGMVEYGKPRTAVLTATSKALGRMGGTLPHELEHTLQKTRKDAPGFQEVSRFRNVSSDQTARRFGTWDERYDDLQERLAALPEEQRNQITDEHSVFGNYLRFGDELMARLRAAEMLEAARGGDFYQSEMGQALFPTDDDKAYMVGSTLPGEANMTPPWSFERTDEAPTSVEDQRKSYARRLLEMLPGYAEGGEVQPPMTDYVFPNRPRDYVSPSSTTSAEDLQRLGTQAGLLGLGFAPGAGMADYFGYFPSAQGGTEPSAVQNFQEGNYGTAAMQGLGAVGDLAMVVPAVGMAVGSVLKAPRAAQRMLQELPKVDELGFYSQVEKAVLDNPQKKGTGDQFLAQIQKTPGVKPEELQYTGLDQFLAGKPSVTKGEIQDYLDANKVQVREVVLGGRTKEQQVEDMLAESGYMPVTDALAELEDGQSFSILDTRTNRAVNPEDLPADLQNRLTQLMDMPEEAFTSRSPAFTTYTLPGGENQREIYLTLPRNTPVPDRTFRTSFQRVENGEVVAQGDEVAAARWRAQDPNVEIREAQVETQASRLADLPENSYRVPQAHSVSPEADVNRLAQLRVNDRVIDGKNTLFIEEIQSDWHQAGRKSGYKSDNLDNVELKATVNNSATEPYYEVRTANGQFVVNILDVPVSPGNEGRAVVNAQQFLRNRGIPGAVPDAPFKTSWDELALKRAIKLASDEGYDQIAFTTGKTQADRYDLSKYMEEIHFSGSNLTAYDKQGNPVVQRTGVTEDQLPELIGKEAAEKLLAQPKQGTLRSLVGQELEVGGEGMKGFYDKMLPKKLEKIGKKYGAKVGKTSMDTPDGPVEVWSMQLPDDLKETVSTQGQPLFQIGAGAVGAGAAGTMLSSDEEPVQNFREGGEVQPYMGDYVFPNRPRNYVPPTPTTTPADLERLSKQVGLMGLGFAPGAGMADYFGQFPSSEGGTEPSAVENWQAGNYGTAAMQGLGAAGDLLYAVPAVGAVLGTAAKGPRTAQRMLKELGFKEDIPREEWLANKVEDAIEGGRNQFGVPKRMGPVTGYFEKNMEVPVDLLARVSGARGEQTNVRPESLDYIRKNWDEVSKEPPFITVDPFGKAWVNEGNHRIMVAKELGVDTLPVEIRYFSGGQRNAEEFSPENILRMQEQKQPPPAPPLESKEFKNWFGTSKVATEEGQPVMLYRGQRRDVGEEGFDLRTRATPSFTDDPNVASIYATDPRGNVGRESMVMPVYMKMERPLDLRGYGSEPATLLDLLSDAGIYGRVDESEIVPIIDDLAKQQYKTGFLYSNRNDLDLDDITTELKKAVADNNEDRVIQLLEDTRIDPYAVADSKKLVEAIKKDGWYDGIIVRDVLVDDLAKQAGTKEYDTYRPFADTQVKSAFNRGTYDPEDPRILYGAGAAGTAGIMSLSGEDAEAAQ